MHFAYVGFTHKGDRRCFSFRGLEAKNPMAVFCLEVDLLLFAKNRVPVQEGPMFCLQLLTAASTATDPTCLEKFRSYQVVVEDFRPLLVERERKAAEKALKTPPRRPFRKPPVASNLHLGVPSKD